MNIKSFKLLIFSICLFGFLFIPICTAFAQTFRTFEKPIVFNDLRKRLSIEYLKVRHGIVQHSATIVPKIIILHWTAIPTLEQSFDVMNPAILPGTRSGIAGASSLNVSTQFLVDRDGTIFRQLPENAFARHVIGLNYCAIGVENVGSSKMPLTKKQLAANESIIRYLKLKYDIQYVIGHYEYKSFIGHPLWKETDPNYVTEKTDPGADFMKKIRRRIKDLNIQGAIKK